VGTISLVTACRDRIVLASAREGIAPRQHGRAQVEWHRTRCSSGSATTRWTT